MMRALPCGQVKAQPRTARCSSPQHAAHPALYDRLGRVPASIRPVQAPTARETSARIERGSPRCACGGNCPKCEAQKSFEERRTEEHAARRDGEGDVMDGGMPPPSDSPLDGTIRGGVEDDPIVEYANGETSCNRDTGAMSTVIHNTKCTRPCTVEHEDDHRAYRGACCRTYAAARKAAIAAGDTDLRNALTRRYSRWISATSDFSECRAYRVSVACGERMESDLGCRTPTEENRSCCADVRSYLTTVRASRDRRCPGTDETCPDFSA